MPIMDWTEYADHAVVHICRSLTASQPRPDPTVLRTLVAAGLGGLAAVACVADLPACGALLYQVATSQTTVAVAEAVLCAAAGRLSQ